MKATNDPKGKGALSSLPGNPCAAAQRRSRGTKRRMLRGYCVAWNPLTSLSFQAESTRA